MSRRYWLLAAAATLLMAMGCEQPSPTPGISVPLEDTYAGEYGYQISDSNSLYTGTWVEGGFKVQVAGSVHGGKAPYKVSLFPPTSASKITYTPATQQIAGLIYVPAKGDPGVRVVIDDSSVPKLHFDRILPEVRELASVAPSRTTAPSFRIVGLPGQSNPSGCSVSLSVSVAGEPTGQFRSYWSGPARTGTVVNGSGNFKVTLRHAESVSVVVRQVDPPTEVGRPAAFMSAVPC